MVVEAPCNVAKSLPQHCSSKH